MIVGLPATISAKDNTFNLSEAEETGFNALDHVLQKPLENPVFPKEHQGFGKHIFLSAGAGISVANNNTLTSFAHPGYRMSAQVGSWFTPVHGIRLDITSGMESVKGDFHRDWFISGHVDYLTNISALLRGENPYRKFELIGAIGFEYQNLRVDEKWHGNYGIGTSLQMRFNVLPYMYLYVEPRAAFLAGHKYGGQTDYSRLTTDLSLSVGVGYRMMYDKSQEHGITEFEQKKDDNLFIGVGAGVATFPRNNSNPTGGLAYTYAGKMLSSVSGFQAAFAFGIRKNDENRRQFGIGTIDYVLNLDNAFAGYRPRKFFKMQMNAGVGIGIATAHNHPATSPAFGVGLTGMFRLSDNWALTIHPQAYFLNNRFYDKLSAERSSIITCDLGVRYTIGNFSTNFEDSYDEYNDEASHWFVTASGGYGARMRGRKVHGPEFFVGVGKRFTPISSWRASFNGAFYSEEPKITDYTLNLDYLSSITTAMYGYNPYRLFDLQGMIGVIGGITNSYNEFKGDHEIKPVYGIKAGLQPNFRINRMLDIYLEPYFTMLNIPNVYNGRYWTAEIRGNVGLRYRFGH